MQTVSWPGVLLKSIVIAICAGLVAWAYALSSAILLFDGWRSEEFPMVALTASLGGSFMIGLPVALLTFFLSRDHLVRWPATLCMIVCLAGIMMVLASFAVGGRDGAIGWGAPAFLAAVTYGVLGWLWIIRPMQKRALDDG